MFGGLYTADTLLLKYLRYLSFSCIHRIHEVPDAYYPAQLNVYDAEDKNAFKEAGQHITKSVTTYQFSCKL